MNHREISRKTLVTKIVNFFRLESHKIYISTLDWVTEDLLTKIMKHPKLSKQFMDPRFSKAIEKFQTNPREVMEMCSTNEELREFIQQFCALMGDHFTGLADAQEKVSFMKIFYFTVRNKKNIFRNFFNPVVKRSKNSRRTKEKPNQGP